MESRYEDRGVVWVDLESPTVEEVANVAEEFRLSPLIADELVLPSSKPRFELHDDFLYVVLHFPALRHTHKTREQEIDFVVGRNFVISAHYDTVDPLHKFSKVFEVNSMLGASATTEHAGFLFYYMVRKLYRAVEHELEYVRHALRGIEEGIFSGREVELVSVISVSSRDLLNLRHTIEPHREILHELEAKAPGFFGLDFKPYLRSLSNEYYRVHNHIMRETESLHELRETNNSLLSTKQNETMKIFTILAFVTFPLSLIAAIFSMDTVHDPIIGQPHDFLMVMGIMGFATLIMFGYFRYKKWL